MASSATTWATEQDWNTHQDYITRLYFGEKKPLKEVQKIMKEKEGFNATTKMFKFRFTKWGLRKNKPFRKPSRQPLALTETAGSPSTELLVMIPHHYRTKTSHNYSQPVGSYPSQPVLLPAQSEWVPIYKYPPSPDLFRSVEVSLYAVNQYARGHAQNNCFGLGALTDYYWGSDWALHFWQEIRLFNDNFGTIGTLSANFQLLNKAFESYAAALESPTPTIVWTTVLAHLVLTQAGPELAISFSRYAAALCTIRLGVSHPLAQLWSILRSMSNQQLKHHATTILEAYSSALESDVVPLQLLRRVTPLHSSTWLFHVGAITFQEAAAALEKSIGELDAMALIYPDLNWSMASRYFYIGLLCFAENYESALEVTNKLGILAHQGSPEFAYNELKNLNQCQTFYVEKAKVLEALDRLDEATPYYIGAYTIAKIRACSDNSTFRLASYSAGLEAHFRKKGDFQSAELTRAEAEVYWNKLVKEA